METKEILQTLPNLSISDTPTESLLYERLRQRERLKIAESALQLVLKEQHSLTKDEQKRLLAVAAITAISDYTPGGYLNIFSDLEGEDFYDYPDEDLHNSEIYVQR